MEKLTEEQKKAIRDRINSNTLYDGPMTQEELKFYLNELQLRLKKELKLQ